MQTQVNHPVRAPENLLRLPQVIARVNLSKSAIYEMAGRCPPDFPRPLKLSRRAVCWTASSIDDWIAKRVAAAELAGSNPGVSAPGGQS